MTAPMELHPLCTLFPRMSGAEFAALKGDIAANGMRTPIVVHDGQILDGGNRYAACLELGIKPATIPFSGGDPVSFVLSVNFHRRHLSAGQQATVVAAAQDWSRASSHGGDRSKVQPLHLETVADRAKASGASLRTQKMADKVAKESPELAKKVAHGEISLPKAAAQLAPERPPTRVATLEKWPYPVQESAGSAVKAPAEFFPGMPVDVDVEEEDDTPDLVVELSKAEREITHLRSELAEAQQRIAALQSSESGAALESLRLERDQARSLGEQRFNELNAAKKELSQSKALLERLRKLAKVETNGELCDLVNSIAKPAKAA